MRIRPPSPSLALVALGTAAMTAVAAAPASAGTAPAPATGRSTTTAPYVLPVGKGVGIRSVLTVNDPGAAANGYEMVGIPDGLGAYREGRDTVVLMNHEIGNNAGTVRAHGQRGAFVATLRVDRKGAVVAGEDFVKTVEYYRYLDGTYGDTPQPPAGAAAGTHTAAFNRLCSGTLTAPGQLLAGKGSRAVGYDGRLYFANEESGNEARAFAVTLDGKAYQLPRLGLFSWENTLAAANDTATTVVMGDEDGPANGSELRVYAGTKQAAGSPVDKAGLTNGRNHVLTVPGVANDSAFRAAYGKGTAAPFSLQDVDWNQNGAAQNAEAAAEGGLGFSRIEDGAFNPANKNEYFFVTTEGGDKTPAPTGSRDGGGLWKLTFNDVERPQLGGSLALLLDGSEEWSSGESRLNKPDNVTIDREGNLLIQEDPGGNDHLARIVTYRIADGARAVLARFDSRKFGVSNPAGTTPDDRAALTTDEESSGIVQLPDGSFLFGAQVHTKKGLRAGTGQGTVEEYVENGQLLRMQVRDFDAVYGRARPGRDDHHDHRDRRDVR